LIISLVAFTLSKFVPKDQVLSVLNMRGVKTDINQVDEKTYHQVYLELGKDKPNFYFSILPQHYPKNLNAIAFGKKRKLYTTLLKRGYSGETISNVLGKLSEKNIPFTEFENVVYNNRETKYFSQEGILNVQQKSFFLPKIVWHGMDNQYHKWIKSFFTGSFGISISDGKSALDKVKNAMKWTLSITLIDLIISIALGLYIGILLVKFGNKKWAKALNQLLYFIYAIPVFWLATLLVVYLTTDDYGSWTNVFPSIGLDVHPGKSTMQQIFLNAPKLILPIICLTLHSLGYTTRFLKRSLNDELNKDYMLTAFAKGMTKEEAITKHALKNALIPFITVFVSAAIAAFGGSLILEVIFNIPGIGRLLYNAIGIADWNVVFCILMIISTVTVIIYLIGDILYAYFNPDIKFS